MWDTPVRRPDTISAWDGHKLHTGHPKASELGIQKVLGSCHTTYTTSLTTTRTRASPQDSIRKWLVLCRAESPWEDGFLSAAAPAATSSSDQWVPQTHNLLTPLSPGRKMLLAPALPSLPPRLKLSGCWWGNESALLYLSLCHLAVCEDWWENVSAALTLLQHPFPKALTEKKTISHLLLLMALSDNSTKQEWSCKAVTNTQRYLNSSSETEITLILPPMGKAWTATKGPAKTVY